MNISDIKKLKYLTEINLDFNKIKRITLDIYENDYNNEEYESYFVTLFKLKGIHNNL